HDGDLLAVHSTPVAENGAIVVARLDDEVTVKRLKRGRSKQFLQLLPENDDLDPIDVDLSQSNFSIEGLSVGVIRRSLA
ncbi:MAG: S24 family peptidase, partial [Pseudomonadota bacterium]